MNDTTNLQDFINQSYNLSLLDKFKAVGLLAAQLPLDVIDMKDILDILVENKNKLKNNDS